MQSFAMVVSFAASPLYFRVPQSTLSYLQNLVCHLSAISSPLVMFFPALLDSPVVFVVWVPSSRRFEPVVQFLYSPMPIKIPPAAANIGKFTHGRAKCVYRARSNPDGSQDDHSGLHGLALLRSKMRVIVN